MKKWRKLRDMSQEELARKITENPPDSIIFHQQTIQKIENGNRGISLTDAVQIAVALDIDLNTLLSITDGDQREQAERQNAETRRQMHIARLALDQLGETLDRIEKVYNVAPHKAERESVQRQIATGVRDDAEAWAKKRHDSMHEQIGEELAKHVEVDHGVDK